MKKFYYSRLKYLTFLLTVFLPLYIVNAGYSFSSKLEPPLGGGGYTLKNFVADILAVVVDIGVPVVVLAIIYSGFLFVKAQGNETELTKAKNAFFWTVIGAAVILGSWALALAIGGTIDQIKR